MGGSVVGISYQKQSMRWKSATIAVGMPAAYILVSRINALTVIASAAILAVLAYLLFSKRDPRLRNDDVRELEDKMKDCCL